MLKFVKIPSKALLIFVCLIIIGLVEVGALWWKADHPKAPNNHSSSSQSSDSAGQNPNLAFNKSKYSTTDPTSIWVVVNKKHPLSPISYAPSDLIVPNVLVRVPGNESMQMRSVSGHALEQMFAAAKSNNLPLMLASGYRSYTYQLNLYNSYVNSQGQTVADQQSARPGHSEHQTGFAVDIEPAARNCELEKCFADTSEGRWLTANSYKYGFILRYTQDKVAITGYEYEPWHFRYVGVELATEMHNKNIEALEEFFGISGGTSY